MRMRYLLSIILGVAVLLTGIISCGKPVPQAVLSPSEVADLPTTARTGFNFILKYGTLARNEINTFECTFTKDMVIDPAITIDMVLTAEEMDSIYQKMLEIDFFNYPEAFRVNITSTLTTIRTPYQSYYFTVEKDSQIKKVNFDDEIMNPDVKADKLRELIYLILGIIESKAEYQALPEPTSGYL